MKYPSRPTRRSRRSSGPSQLFFQPAFGLGEPAAIPAATASAGIQRQFAGSAAEGAVLRREAGNTSGGFAAPPSVGQVLASNGGQPIDTGTRRFMETRFGQDFGQVRIHTDRRAADSAAAIQARAYTSGRNIVFGAGEYRPESSEGRRLLAHELVHVVQQRGEVVSRQEKPTDMVPAQCTNASGILIAAASRTLGEIGQAYDKGEQAGWWYSPNGNLAGARSKPYKWEIQQGAKYPLPSSNVIVNWGNEWTCNLFVYDVLHQAGLTPPMGSNNHYYDANQTYKLDGKLKGYFSKITDVSLVCPGDIVATGPHMEIVATKIDASGNYESYGAHADGAYLSARLASSGDRFFRVK